MLKNLLVCISIFALIFGVTSSGNAEVRTYSNEFLAIGVGASGLGMSNAFVAKTNDVTAGYWNPAGLLGVNSDIQIALMHSEYFQGMVKYDYGAIASKLDSNSAVGFSFIRAGVDKIPNTLELIDSEGNINYDKIKWFSAADNAYMFSYARKSKVKGLNYGGTIKVIYRKVGSFAKAWGFGLDAGVQYKTKKWNLAVMVRDVTSTFNAWSFSFTDAEQQILLATSNEVPENSIEVTLPKMIWGIARDVKLGKEFVLTPEIDVDFTFDGKRNTVVKSNFSSISPHAGIELGYHDLVYVRAGIGQIQSYRDFDDITKTKAQPNIGVGIKMKNLTIDYALTNVGGVTIAPYSNVFSLKLNINKRS
ncbi:MAG: PorV/PorQ family protein [Flavobacteriales bacterium]|nr:PorV/PorQ family protein [Flavobacteriales bacterium]